MFNALRQGSSLMVLDKGGENPGLRIGQVQSVSQPVPKFGQPAYALAPETTIDIVVKYEDGTSSEFKQVPSQMSVANFGHVVIAETKDLMNGEVEAWIGASKNAMAQIPYHQKVLEVGEKIQVMLNPQLAREKETEDRVARLEKTMNNIETMLAEALNRK